MRSPPAGPATPEPTGRSKSTSRQIGSTTITRRQSPLKSDPHPPSTHHQSHCLRSLRSVDDPLASGRPIQHPMGRTTAPRAGIPPTRSASDAARPPIRTRRAASNRLREGHSHSMVPGGLEVTSSTTRLTSLTSFVMRLEIFESTSYGRRVQSAVMASSLETGRSTIGWP